MISPASHSGESVPIEPKASVMRKLQENRWFFTRINTATGEPERYEATVAIDTEAVHIRVDAFYKGLNLELKPNDDGSLTGNYTLIPPKEGHSVKEGSIEFSKETDNKLVGHPSHMQSIVDWNLEIES